MKRTLIPVALAGLVVGCASSTTGTGPEVWYNPEHTRDTPANQPARDLAACRMGGVSTGTAIGGFNGKSFLAGALINDGRKKEFNENCMISKGYLKVRQSAVPQGLPYIQE